jgi:calcineurin-like phosphoesterase
MNMMYTRKKFRFDKAEGEVWFNGAVFEIDEGTKLVKNIERLYFSATQLAENK